MARRIGALAFNLLGQTLELMSRAGRPSSATFKVLRQFALDESTAEFSGNATIDTANTTLSGPAGQAQSDPNRIPLASSAGFVANRRYPIAQNGLQEWVDVLEVGTGYVRAHDPLQNDYTAGATFSSTWVSAAVDAAFIQNLSNLSDLFDTAPDYRVVWTLTVGGVVQPAVYSFFDVVRTVLGPAVDMADVDAAVPGILDTLPVQHRGDQGRRLIDRAWSSVRADLIASRIDVNALRDDEALDELVILRTIRALAEGGWAPVGVDKTEFLRNAVENYSSYLEQHVKVVLQHATVGREGATQVADPIQAAWGK